MCFIVVIRFFTPFTVTILKNYILCFTCDLVATKSDPAGR